MAQMTILVGTVGQGIMRSGDSGKTWGRVGIRQGMHSDAVVRALVNHPHHPEITYAGSDKGLYRSDDAGEDMEFDRFPSESLQCMGTCHGSPGACLHVRRQGYPYSTRTVPI